MATTRTGKTEASYLEADQDVTNMLAAFLVADDALRVVVERGEGPEVRQEAKDRLVRTKLLLMTDMGRRCAIEALRMMREDPSLLPVEARIHAYETASRYRRSLIDGLSLNEPGFEGPFSNAFHAKIAHGMRLPITEAGYDNALHGMAQAGYAIVRTGDVGMQMIDGLAEDGVHILSIADVEDGMSDVTLRIERVIDRDGRETCVGAAFLRDDPDLFHMVGPVVMDPSFRTISGPSRAPFAEFDVRTLHEEDDLDVMEMDEGRLVTLHLSMTIGRWKDPRGMDERTQIRMTEIHERLEDEIVRRNLPSAAVLGIVMPEPRLELVHSAPRPVLF